MAEISAETATANLLASFEAHRSRRMFLQGIAATGLAAAGTGLLAAAPVLADPATADQLAKIKAIFTIARTAEQLAITFYTNGIFTSDRKNVNTDIVKNDAALSQLIAALVEEQIHQQFFTANGGDSLADTFSFPQGAKTFTDLNTFIDTQQQLEGSFDSAFLAAVREFGELGQSSLSQIAAQIAMIESEHRVLGRNIGGRQPADNWVFAPVTVAFVADAPGVLKDAGYLSPTNGNSYKYAPVSTDFPGLMSTSGPMSKRPYNLPSAAPASGSPSTPGTPASGSPSTPGTPSPGDRTHFIRRLGEG